MLLLLLWQTMEKLINSSKEDLTLCPGLGPQKASAGTIQKHWMNGLLCSTTWLYCVCARAHVVNNSFQLLPAGTETSLLIPGALSARQASSLPLPLQLQLQLQQDIEECAIWPLVITILLAVWYIDRLSLYSISSNCNTMPTILIACLGVVGRLVLGDCVTLALFSWNCARNNSTCQHSTNF